MSESMNSTKKPVNPKRAENIAKAAEKRIREENRKIGNMHARQEAAAARSPQEQIKRLDARLGIGVGAEKERAKLQAKIDAENPSPVKAPSKRAKLTKAERDAKEIKRGQDAAAHAAQ